MSASQIVLTCRACSQAALLERSELPELDHRAYGAETWTDAASAAEQEVPGWWAPPLLRCPSCQAVALVEAVRHLCDEVPPPRCAQAGAAEVWEALARGLARDPAEELRLRLYGWRRASDAERERGGAALRTPESQANLDALVAALTERPPELRLAAELLRQHGQFAASLELLARLPRALQDEGLAASIRRRAEAGQTAVARVEEGSRDGEAMRCPACGAAGRWRRDGHALFPPHARGGCGESAPLVAACARCDRVSWLGEGPRPATCWEQLQGPLAAGGCLSLLVACPMVYLSARIGLGVLLGAGILIALQSLLQALLERSYPSTRLLEPSELLALCAQRAWVGPEEERWLRLSALLADPSEGAAQLANRRALLPLLSDAPSERWVAAWILERSGQSAQSAALRERAEGATRLGGSEARLLQRFRVQLEPPPAAADPARSRATPA